MTKKRYLKSFSLTLVLYSIIFVTIILNLDSIKKVKVEDNKKLISLNQVYIVPQEKKVKNQKEKKVETKKIIKKKIEKKIVKKQIKEKPKKVKKLVKKDKIKKVLKPKKIPEKVVEEKIEEKTKIDERLVEKENSTQEKEIIEKKVVRNYSKEYLEKHLKEIVKLIQQNIKYPKRAKRLNIQGEVIVEFKLLNTGEVINIKAIDGHRFLIKSSIKAIINASKDFPKVNKTIKIKVPISYKLV
ncbi:MAG: energy transducer TonB [Halarcobacter sp.]